MLAVHRSRSTAILTQTARDVLPPDRRLDSVVDHLERQADVRALIGFVELWAAVAQPTAHARRAQARALLSLGLTDRAWIRLRELTDRDPADADAWLITAEMFLARRWPTRARTALEHASKVAPEDARLVTALARCQDTPELPDPELDDRALDDVEVLLERAEAHAATGAMLNAAVALERVRKLEPENPRAADMLWGLAGQYELPDETLVDAVERLGPGLGELADQTEDVEHTESLWRADQALADGDAAFPSLFRHRDQAPLEPEEHTAEVTRSVALTDLAPPAAEDPRDSDEPTTDPSGGPLPDAGRGDTEILHVIHRDGRRALRPSDGPIHSSGIEIPSDDFDLDAWRREMGMEPPDADVGDLGPALEDEDDDLIVLTRGEARSARPDPVPIPEELDPETTATLARDTLPAAPPRPPDPPGPAHAAPPARAPGSAPPQPGASWWLFSIGLVFWLAAAVLLVAVIVRLATT